MPPEVIVTARLTLRPLVEGDGPAVVAALNDLSVTGWLAVVPHPYTTADFRQFLTGMARPGQTYAVDDGAGLAGIVGAGRELGYWFAPRVHGQGYATEAARAVLAAQFAADPAAVKSGYFEGNDRSARVLAKLGGVESGRSAKHCRAMGTERPHVDMLITPEAFAAALPIEARSARLSYRALQAIDAAALHRIVGHWPVVRQLYSWPWPADPAFTRTRAAPYRGDGFAWGIFGGDALIGSIAVTAGELGYFLAPEAWGKGYGFEACTTAIDHAFAAGRDHLTAGVWADNEPSLRLLAKLGFKVTGADLTWSPARGADTPGQLLRLDRSDWHR
jgi:RimJ/RimL family protein N-acetyltransferase